MSTPDEKPKPTVGLRVSVSKDGIYHILDVDKWNEEPTDEQAIIDAAWINQCLEEVERRNLNIKPPDETGDLMVDLGDLTHSKLGTMVQDEAFELQVIDYIDTFNNAVIQGIPPFRAARAMAQAFTLVLASCLRANLHPGVVAALLQGVIESTKAAGKFVKVITKHHN